MHLGFELIVAFGACPCSAFPVVRETHAHKTNVSTYHSMQQAGRGARDRLVAKHVAEEQGARLHPSCHLLKKLLHAHAPPSDPRQQEGVCRTFRACTNTNNRGEKVTAWKMEKTAKSARMIPCPVTLSGWSHLSLTASGNHCDMGHRYGQMQV